MDEDYLDWKPDKVKLESELILDSDITVDAPFSVSHAEGNHYGPSETYTEQSWTFPERIELNLTHGLPSMSKFIAGASQDAAVKIKEEPAENVTPSPDSFVDCNGQTSAKAGPSAYHREDFVFESIKSEDNFIEENDARKNIHLNLDFTEANKETRVKDCSMDNRKHLSSLPALEGSSMYPEPSINISCSPSTSFMSTDGSMEYSNKLDAKNCTESLLNEKTFPLRESSGTSMPCSDGMSLDATLSIEKRFSCDLCPAKFTRKHSLTIHQLTHSNEKAFRCDQCSARFNQKGYLKKHLIIHTDKKPFSCDQCSARFTLKSNLKQHFLIHTGEKAFPCDQCSAWFTQKGALKKHLLIHAGEKAFPCDQCSARFTLKSNLTQHLLIHTGKKAFPCDQCSARFTQKGSLRKHLVTHTNVKAFSCDQCSARFTQSSSLKQHLLIHTGVKAFNCDQCPARFTLKAYLKKHLERCRRERTQPSFSAPGTCQDSGVHGRPSVVQV